MSPVNKFGCTPLHYAVNHRYSNAALVTLLLDAGADISATSSYCHTVLFTATRWATAPIVQLLLNQGAVPDIREVDGATLLHWAAEFGTAETVQLILDAGLIIEAKNKSGETSLHCASHYATHFDRGGAIKALLKSGADFHAIDYNGFTPLQTLLRRSPSNYAAYSILHHLTGSISGLRNGGRAYVLTRPSGDCDEPVVDQLLSAGGNIRASSISTRSPLDWAI
jgi:serine/threonine-protein phosphatase 6 regulatory ankyrin repeat subunit B